MKTFHLGLLLGALGSQAIDSPPAGSPDCGSLLDQKLDPAVRVLNATNVTPGALNLSEIVNSVAFCRVQGRLVYGAEGNDTLFWELFLPSTGVYNGNYMAVGNGGLAGYIDYATMLTNLNAGFAVAGCDSGHQLSENGNGTVEASQAIPFLQDPVQVQAWIHHSIAMMTPPAQYLTGKYYSATPEYNYYYGCSTGGAQGFALAQFYPTMFDGIYAGSPGNWYSHLALSFLWNAQHFQGDAAMSQNALAFITKAVVKACDHLDGTTDQLVEDPLKCSFNISSLQCKASQQPVTNNKTVCLTASQVVAAQAVYAGPRDSRTGAQLYPGFDLSSEVSWLVQESTLAQEFTIPILQNLVFKNLSYDATTFDWDSDVDIVNREASPLIDEISVDLSAFRARGGKLITTQGWADPYNAATWPIQHWQRIQRAIGGDVTDFMRLFMIPGGGHCGAASGYPHVPSKYDVLNALVPWVEKDVPPASMLSSSPPDGTNTTRKLCVWPHTAKYKGSGSANDSTSYNCV